MDQSVSVATRTGLENVRRLFVSFLCSPASLKIRGLLSEAGRKKVTERPRLDRKLDTSRLLCALLCLSPILAAVSRQSRQISTRLCLSAAALVLAGCTTPEIGHQCPRIVPQVAYDSLLARSSVHLVAPRMLGESCPAGALACSRPIVQASQVLAADIYIPSDGDSTFEQRLLFHEVCHLYEIDSGAKTVEQTSMHEGWLRYTQ